MNYQKIYDQIIDRAKTRQIEEGYVEKHHIVPKCLGGNNSKSNIVQLTAREHFICHQLLVEIYPNEPKLKHALFLMSIGKQKARNKHYKINNRTYERLKLEYALFLTGKKQSEKTKQKKSESMKKVWKNKTGEEMTNKANKVWETRTKNGTNIVTEEQAKNISKALLGRKTPWINKMISQYTLDDKWVMDWESKAEIMRDPRYGNVQGCTNGSQKTAYGYVWKFKEN
jgi:hypothetical protein